MENKNFIYAGQAGIIVSLFFFILTGCSGSDKIVARVGDSELSESDAIVLMQHYEIDINDQTAYEEFLSDWCENEIYKQELKANHSEEWELVRLRAERYGADLSQYYLEEIKLKEKLDTLVSEEELKAFYDEHKEEFILHDYIVKALYLKIPKSVDYKEKKIQQKYLLKNDKDLSEINSYAKLYAENFYFDDSSWIYFTELAEDIPLTKYNVDNIVLNRTKTYFSDDEHTYFLNIIDYKLKDEAPPLDFLRDQLKEIIVTTRLQALKEENGPKLLKELKSKYEISIHP